MSFTADRIGPASRQATIVEDLTELQKCKALVVVPTKSVATGGPGGDDSLALYCNPTEAPQAERADIERRWNNVISVFNNTYIPPNQIGIIPPVNPGVHNRINDPSQYSIELRTVPATQPSLLSQTQVIPELRTRSALGSLMISIDEHLQLIKRSNSLRMPRKIKRRQPPSRILKAQTRKSIIMWETGSQT